MHLWLFSSGGILNHQVDVAMASYFKTKTPRLAFIPSSHDTASLYFSEFVQRYGALSFDSITLFEIDGGVKKHELAQLLDFDLIYLSGGNTFYFLHFCRKSGLFDILDQFSRKGGIIAGHSAGAILLTPIITTASYPEDDRDENEIGLKNWHGAGLVNFEVFPHFDQSAYYRDVLRGASLDSAYVIYGVPDGSAICINGPSISFFGNVWAFYNGEEFAISGI